MPRRSLLLSCAVAFASQLSAGCCCWRPFAHCWAGHSACAPCVGAAPVGCSSCGSSPIASTPVMAAPSFPVTGVGYPVAPPPVVGTGGSVFTAPSQPLAAPRVSQEAFPPPH